jgi:hypothetical protein
MKLMGHDKPKKEEKTMTGESRIYMCGLYRKKDKNGKEYLVGEMSDSIVLFVFPNRNKAGGDDPDYDVFLRERRPESGYETQEQERAPSEFPE